MQKSIKKVININDDLCIGCGACVVQCPTKTLYIDSNINKCRVHDQQKCGRKRCCEKVCPTKAIKIL
ncbi:ferredoxin family protein [Candidatus Omnitrophota bacterium]